MFESNRFWSYTGLGLFYLVSVFFLIEAALRIYYAATDNVPPHSDYSVRKEWRWVNERRLSGNASFNKNFDYDKWIGWNNRANIDTDEIQTNAQHMRNVQTFAAGPHPERRRLLILGDSISFGYGVTNQETYAYQLADKYLPEWDILNMSISATGTDQHIVNYEQYGKRYNPNIVVLGFYLLDYSRNLIRFRYYAKPKFQLRGDKLILTGSPVPLPEKLYDDYESGNKTIGGWSYSYAFAAFAEPIISHYIRDRSEGSVGRRVLAALMKRFNDQVLAEGSVPIWLILPDRDVVEKGLSKYGEIAEFSENTARSIGLAVLNMDQPFRAFAKQYPDDKIWRPKDIGGHLSHTGHKLVANRLYSYIRDKGLFRQMSDE